MAARRMMLPDYGTVSMKGTQYYRTRVTDQQGRRVSLYARTREELYQKEQEAIQQIEIWFRLRRRKNHERLIDIRHRRTDQFVLSRKDFPDISLFFLFI